MECHERQLNEQADPVLCGEQQPALSSCSSLISGGVTSQLGLEFDWVAKGIILSYLPPLAYGSVIEMIRSSVSPDAAWRTFAASRLDQDMQAYMRGEVAFTVMLAAICVHSNEVVGAVWGYLHRSSSCDCLFGRHVRGGCKVQRHNSEDEAKHSLEEMAILPAIPAATAAGISE